MRKVTAVDRVVEGFVDAQIMVEGLKRAGKDLTRDKFVEAMETIKDFDLGLGDDKANYSKTDHKGLETVFITVVKDGEVRDFDPKTLKPIN